MDVNELVEKINGFDVNDIDWNNMGSWPVVGKIVFATIVFFGVLAGTYFLDVQGLLEENQRVLDRENVLKKEFESQAFRVANLDAYKKQLEEIEESFGSLLRQLPRETEVAGLLEDITSAAVGASLEIVSIKLDEEAETEFYTELPINIDVVGEYHDFGAFVSAVAGLGRIVTLHDFEVSSAEVADENKLNLKIVAKTYRYNSETKKKKLTKRKKR
jgi:type IV pilus assembly protein PilO